MERETRKLADVIITALRDKGINLAKLAELSGISERYLESLIEEKYDTLPSSPYVRGYLLKIAEILGLDGETLWREYLRDDEMIRRSGRRDELPSNRFALPKIPVKIFAIGLLVIFVVIFFTLRLSLFKDRGGLELKNLSLETTIVENSSFTVSGGIDPAYRLSLNGERIYPGEDGEFEKNIILQEGFNTLVFRFKKFLSEEKVVTKQIFYKKKVGSPEF